jgi:hypothetical protein
VLTPESISQACIESADHIVHHSGSIHWVKSLPIKRGSLATSKKSLGADLQPTHFLRSNVAMPLGALSKIDSNIVITISDSAVFLERKAEYSLNEKTVDGKQSINLGDRVRLGSDAETMQFIRVSN